MAGFTDGCRKLRAHQERGPGHGGMSLQKQVYYFMIVVACFAGEQVQGQSGKQVAEPFLARMTRKGSPPACQ